MGITTSRSAVADHSEMESTRAFAAQAARQDTDTIFRIRSEAAMGYSVPNIPAAIVDPQKLYGYLVSPDHPVGRNKSRVFAGCGYAQHNADELIAELKRILQYGQLVDVIESVYGSKYIVEGDLRCSSGHLLVIRTVWIVETDTMVPRFVTAYPV